MNQKQQKNKFDRIGAVTAILMIGIAIFYDAIELVVDLIPLVGQAVAFYIDIFATAHFALWFMICGVSLVSPKKIIRFWLPVLIEFLPVPVIDTFVLTLGIVLTIFVTWTEDGVGISPNPTKIKDSITRAKTGLQSKITKAK